MAAPLLSPIAAEEGAAPQRLAPRAYRNARRIYPHCAPDRHQFPGLASSGPGRLAAHRCLRCRFRCWRPKLTMPAPDGTPEAGTVAALAGAAPACTGAGDTDCTLAALQTAAASVAGPGTWLLAGMAPS